MNRWVYALSGVVILLMAGLVYAWSVLSKSIAAEFTAWTKTELSLTFTITMTLFCIGCLVAGILAKKVHPRAYLILSAFLFLAGFMIAASAQSPAVLYLGFGVLCGLGSGFAYNAVMSTISSWFPDKQGLISGILLMGFGLSSFIVGKIFAFMAPADGSGAWRSTFRIFAVVICIILVLCSFVFEKPAPEDLAQFSGGKKKNVRPPASEMTTAQMTRNRSFWLYYLWAILLSGAGLALVAQASGIAGQVGTSVSDGTIATVVGLISILNGIGRVFFGTLFDKKGFRPTMILDMIIFIIAGVILIIALISGNFMFIIIGFVVGGFAYGAVTPTNSAIISDFFGRRNYPMNFSIINTNLIIASFASTIAGKLYDMSGSYLSTIIMMIGLTVAGFVVFLGIRRPVERHENTESE
ncbi:MAG: MFS transporter [Lachnospiraceae bacterium]|nr:MFS transporter [Lachnospiraceae bacterium]